MSISVNTAKRSKLTPEETLLAAKAISLALGSAHDLALQAASRCTAQTASEFRKAAALYATLIASNEANPALFPSSPL